LTTTLSPEAAEVDDTAVVSTDSVADEEDVAAASSADEEAAAAVDEEVDAFAEEELVELPQPANSDAAIAPHINIEITFLFILSPPSLIVE
jgi:nucleoid-associated protein YgaU